MVRIGYGWKEECGGGVAGKGDTAGTVSHVPLPVACLSLPLAVDQQKLVVRSRWGAAGTGLGREEQMDPAGRGGSAEDWEALYDLRAFQLVFS